MTYPHGGANQIWRDGYDSAYKPKKKELREWGSHIEDAITAFQAVAASSAIAGAYSDTTLSAAKAAGIAGTAEGDTFSATGADVGFIGVYRHDPGGLAFEFGKLPLHSEFLLAKDATASIDAAITQVLTGGATEETITSPHARLVPSDAGSEMIVLPQFEGVDLDTPVIPGQVTVTGKNIVDPDPALWETGQIDASGNETASGSRLRMIGFAPLAPNTQYALRHATGNGIAVHLYDANGVHQRQIMSPGNWTTTPNETQYRVWFVKTQAKPADAFNEEIQIERGSVSSAFEPYHADTRVYGPVELYAHAGAVDRVKNSYAEIAIARKTVAGTAAGETFGIQGPIATTGSYYRATITNGPNLISDVDSVLAIRSDDGDFTIATSSTEEARTVFLNSSVGYIRVSASKIDAMSGADTLEKFRTYLDTFLVEFILKRGAFASSDLVGGGMLFMPAGGSVVVSQSGAAQNTVIFKEVSMAGGGGVALDGRVADLETDVSGLQADATSLQSQIDTLVVGGDSSTEAAQARTSPMGYTSATLKARLDKMEAKSGVFVTDFAGAGSGDDTDMFFAARDYAEANGLDLVVPPRATPYQLRRGVVINKSIRVLGQKGAVVKKVPAVTQNVTADLSVGDTVIPVVDASQFTVGYDVMIGDPGSVLSYPNTIGEITAVNTSNNTITISAYKSVGMETAYATGAAVASQTFAIFYTNRTLNPSVEISPEFWGLKLDGNPQPNEPAAYPMAPIFIDSAHTKDPIIMFNEVLASASDGVSDQSDGGGYIQGNTVRNCTIHGIHLGFTNGTDKVIGNRAYNCGTSGFFWCFGVTEAFAALNYAENCTHGFYGIDVAERNNHFVSNTCKGCAIDYQIGGMQGGNLTITDHTSEGNTQKVVKADSASNIQINGGMFVSGQGVGLEFLRCENIAVNDPTFLDWEGPSAVVVSSSGATRSVFGTISAMIEGCTEVPIKITSSDDFFVDGCNIKTDCTHDVEIGAATGQAASDGTVFGSNAFRRGVLDGGTNTTGL